MKMHRSGTDKIEYNILPKEKNGKGAQHNTKNSISYNPKHVESQEDSSFPVDSHPAFLNIAGYSLNLTKDHF